MLFVCVCMHVDKIPPGVSGVCASVFLIGMRLVFLSMRVCSDNDASNDRSAQVVAITVGDVFFFLV